MEKIVRLFAVVLVVVAMSVLWGVGFLIYSYPLLQVLFFGSVTAFLALSALFAGREPASLEKEEPVRVLAIEELVIPQGPPEAVYSARNSEAQLIAEALNAPIVDYRIYGKMPNEKIH